MASTNVVKSPLEAVSMVSEWDKVFAKSDKVDHKKVKFKNRYGVEIVGDLYTPKMPILSRSILLLVPRKSTAALKSSVFISGLAKFLGSPPLSPV